MISDLPAPSPVFVVASPWNLDPPNHQWSVPLLLPEHQGIASYHLVGVGFVPFSHIWQAPKKFTRTNKYSIGLIQHRWYNITVCFFWLLKAHLERLPDSEKKKSWPLLHHLRHPASPHIGTTLNPWLLIGFTCASKLSKLSCCKVPSLI